MNPGAPSPTLMSCVNRADQLRMAWPQEVSRFALPALKGILSRRDATRSDHTSALRRAHFGQETRELGQLVVMCARRPLGVIRTRFDGCMSGRFDAWHWFFTRIEETHRRGIFFLKSFLRLVRLPPKLPI